MAINLKTHNEYKIISNDEAYYLINSVIENNLDVCYDSYKSKFGITTRLGDLVFFDGPIDVFDSYIINKECNNTYGLFIPALVSRGMLFYGWSDIGKLMLDSKIVPKNQKNFIVQNLNLFS